MGKTKLSYRDAWRERFDRDREDHKEVLTWDIFENWERSSMPESRAEDDFIAALEILFSGRGKKLAEKYMQRSLDRIQRAVDDKKYEAGRCKSRFPRNRGCGTRVQQYVQALRDREFSPSTLMEAVADYEQWLSNLKKWNEVAQAQTLDAVRMSLIADEPARAAAILKKAKPLRKYAESKLWKRLAEIDSDLPVRDDALVAELDAVLDPLRVPNYRSEVFMVVGMVRFELAVLRQKYFGSKQGEIDWTAALKQVTG